MRLQKVVNNARLAEAFTVTRSQGGNWVAGGWQDKYVTISMYGIISPNNDPRLAELLPDSDHVHQAITVNCELPLYVTREKGSTGPATSDIVIWNNEQYRVIKTHNYALRGYWWAYCVRMAGA